MTVDDPQQFEKGIEKERKLLNEADVDDRDKTAIRQFMEKSRAEGKAVSTLRDRYGLFRRSAERSETPLVEFGLDEYTDLINRLTGEYGVTTGIQQYKAALRTFYRYLHRHEQYPSYGWWEEIKVTRPKNSSIDYKRFTPAEIEQMKDATTNPRDRALVSFLWDTGVRIGLAASLRMGDITLKADRGIFVPNRNANGLKGVEIQEYPMYLSVADVRQWVNQHHPDPENDATPVFCKLRGYDPSTPNQNAVTITQLGDQLKAVGDRAGIDAPTNPHAFRHACLSRLLSSGYTIPDLKARLAWSDGAIVDMVERYDERTREEELARIDELEGREPTVDPGDSDNEPSKLTCPMCGTEATTAARFCTACASPLREHDIKAEQDAKRSIRTVLAHMDPESAERLNEVADRIEEDRDLRSASLDG